jgi:signal peptidase I
MTIKPIQNTTTASNPTIILDSKTSENKLQQSLIEAKIQRENQIQKDLKNKNFWYSFFVFLDKLVAVLIVVLLISLLFIFNFTRVDGISMANTYKTGDRLMINIIDRDFKRNEVITLYSDKEDLGFPISNSINTMIQFSQKKRTILVKRVIALQNEEVEVINGKVVIYNNQNPNGFILDDSSFAKNDWICSRDDGIVQPGSAQKNYQRTKIKNDEVFVMGDNRGCSQDSRFYGPFNKKSVLGKVVFKF